MSFMHAGNYVTAPPSSPVKISRSKGQGHSALLAEGRHRLLGQGPRRHQHLQLPGGLLTSSYKSSLKCIL